MTFIEFFDEIALKNLCACLTYAPERIIFVGDNSKKMKKYIARYEKVFADRGCNIEFLYKTVSKSNLDDVLNLLTEILETYDDCAFGITGGDEIFTFALGMVFAKNPDKNIQIHKFNIMNNTVYDCDKDGTTIYKYLPELSVEENIRIYGGDIVYGDIDENKTYLWDLNGDFVNDINLIWSICKSNTRDWNILISVFGVFEFLGEVSDEQTLTTKVSKTDLEAYYSRHNFKYKIPEKILDYLIKERLLTSFVDGDEIITVSYKNEQVKKCLTRAGQALEMKIYITVKNVLDADGNLIYNDAVNGVVIDWDGKFHDEALKNEYDTENEIDILLMRNIIPIFISCKNGKVTADELYKLNTVAERFGGPYSKKVLVATAISNLGESGKYLRQRAEDMRIKILEDIQNMDDNELECAIKNLWCN